MKNSLFILLYSISISAFSQNARIFILGSARIVASSTDSTKLVLHNTDLDNMGDFNPGISEVIFTGNNSSTIGGNSITTFHNLTINKSAGEVNLFRYSSILNKVELIQGNFNIQNEELNLYNTARIVGEQYPTGRRIYCAGNQSGLISKTFNMNTMSATDIAGMGLNLTKYTPNNVTLQIQRGNRRQQSTAFAGAGNSIGRFYNISTNVIPSVLFDMSFKYHDLELYGMNENQLLFYASSSFGVNSADWQEWGVNPAGPLSPGYPNVGVTVRNPAINEISLTGVLLNRRWTLSDSATQPLPVQLGFFDVQCFENKVRSKWSTQSEVNNAYFEIQRSYDLQNWSSVAQVSGAGNSNTPIEYSYDIEIENREMAYYRLKQVDYNGAFEIFSPKSIACADLDNLQFHLWPNPNKGNFHIEFNTFKNQNIQIDIIDVSGKKVYHKEIETTEGLQQLEINTQGLSTGMYFVRLQSGGEWIGRKPIIIHTY